MKTERKDRIYHARKLTSEIVTAMVEDHATIPTKYRPLHIVQHFGMGKIWFGDAGDGSADLALSILCDHLDERPKPFQLDGNKTRAQKYAQALKMRYIAAAHQDAVKITSNEVEQLIRDVDAEREADHENDA